MAGPDLRGFEETEELTLEVVQEGHALHPGNELFDIPGGIKQSFEDGSNTTVDQFRAEDFDAKQPGN
jgi:hypothetical protein